MTRAMEGAMEGAPAPSVLYSDDPEFGPGGLCLWGMLDDLVQQTDSSMRTLVLSWRGLLAELRPRERAAVGQLIERMIAALTEADRLHNEIHRAYETLRDEDEEREKAAEDAALEADIERDLVERAARRATELALEQSGFAPALERGLVVESIVATVSADLEGG